MVTDTANTAPLPEVPNPFFCQGYADAGFPMSTLNEKAVYGLSAAIRVKPGCSSSVKSAWHSSSHRSVTNSSLTVTLPCSVSHLRFTVERSALDTIRRLKSAAGDVLA